MNLETIIISCEGKINDQFGMKKHKLITLTFSKGLKHLKIAKNMLNFAFQYADQ